MKVIYPYLTFHGNCREAMLFYQACLGGELCFQTIGESPQSEKLPESVKSCILHAVLRSGDFVLMATDMVSEQGLSTGNALSLLLSCSSEGELRKCYRQLAVGGEQLYPLTSSESDLWIAGLVDRYGHSWTLYCHQEKG